MYFRLKRCLSWLANMNRMRFEVHGKLDAPCDEFMYAIAQKLVTRRYR